MEKLINYSTHLLIVFCLGCTSSSTGRRLSSVEGSNCSSLMSSLFIEELTPYKIKRLVEKIDSEEALTNQEEESLLKKFKEVLSEMINNEKEIERLEALKEISWSEKRRLQRLKNKLIENPNQENIKNLIKEIESGDLASVIREGEHSLDTVEDLLNYAALKNDPLSRRGIELLKKEAFTISPLVLLPAASVVFDGGLTLSIIAGLKFAAGIKGMDLALDAILDNTSKFLNARQQAFVLAASGNLPEAGASFLPAMAGRSTVATAGDVPLGSNAANFVLAGVALLSAAKKIAIEKRFLRKGQRLTPRILVKALRSVDYKAMKKEAGYAAYFVSQALIFRYYVKGQMALGNYVPLIGWLTINVPTIALYFAKDAIKNKRLYTGALKEFKSEEIKRTSDLLKVNKDSFKKSSSAIDQILKDIHSVSQSSSVSPKKAKESLSKLKKAMKNDENFRNEVERMMHTLDSEELTALLKMAGIDFETASTMTKPEMTKSIVTIMAGITGVIAMASVLDSGVEDLSESFPQMGKSAAGFFILSFFSSLPELMGTQKLFSQLNFQGGMQNIADSNALNIGLAELSMGMAYFNHASPLEVKDEKGSANEN